ncbi:TonB-dependent receptor plug domain-containing protein [Massilia yuzhufengensis]|uniref:Iron complex outermembrane recepter protein n=1 Tax=Massilia yuzhufengensis TaxID=1164594 RepID=A0A1I1T1P9_9BURK|nr:TonB-dependent receptor [Massilia yuzhufengensis]SFD50978.1 iron complex outermembrane recepter protein [Massilia yuzhufengensis]
MSATRRLPFHPTPSRLAVACLAAMLALPATAASEDQLAAGSDDFADLSIEELANIQVTSVSKKPERLLDAPASVFVITADDIRRAGARSLPEALRLAPNLHVAQGSSYGYAISARGLNGSNNSAPNKLLVMIDGRSVYAPLFSGVFWDMQDLMLEDVERIEVISGPGGTMWGVNAVNGVINITTRPAGATQGSLAVLRAGSDGGDAAFRQGGRSGEASWRVHGKLLRHARSDTAAGLRIEDDWRQAQLGMRADWERGADSFSVNGNVFRGTLGQPEPGAISVTGTALRLGDIDTEGANLSARWERALDDGGRLSVQAYLDHTRRAVPPTFTESLQIADLQLEHTLPAWGRHSLMWGANLRHSWDEVDNSEVIAFLPASEEQTWASLYAQDEIALRPDLSLTLGARVERNDYTGNEFLPTARLSWRLAPRHALWAALSRTVRGPTRLDVDAFIPGRPPYLLRGGPQVRSEVARVAELGYRGQPFAGLSYSATMFHNQYDHLRTQEIDPTQTFLTFGSLMEGEATGIEMWGSYQASSAWRLSAGFTALHQRLRLKPGSNDAAGPGSTGKDPEHTLQLRSHYAFDDRRELEVALRKVAALENPAVPGYWALDARFGWRLARNLELSVVGQNLNGSHGEYGPRETRAEIGRRVGVKLVWTN